MHRAAAASGSVNGGVVYRDEPRIARKLQVRLDERRTLCDCLAERRECVFWSVPGSSTMRNHQHNALAHVDMRS